MEKVLHFFGRKQEIEFANKPFRGKHAGMATKLNQHINGLIRARGFMVIILLSLLNYMYQKASVAPAGYLAISDNNKVIAGILIVSILLYNYFRLPALVLSLIPFAIIIFMGKISFFILAVNLFLGIAIYRHIQAEKLKKELQAVLVEDHLINDQK